MKRKRVLFACGMVAAAVGVLVLTAGAQPQMRGRRARGMLLMACNVEGLWAELSFGVKLADEKLLGMRPTFQKAWDERGKVGDETTSPEDMPAAFEKLQKIHEDLLASVEKGTTEEEFKKLSPWIETQKERLEMMQQMMQRAMGGMGAGG